MDAGYVGFLGPWDLQDLKLHTAQLFDAYDKGEDRIAFLHDQIRTRTFWTKENLAELAS